MPLGADTVFDGDRQSRQRAWVFTGFDFGVDGIGLLDRVGFTIRNESEQVVVVRTDAFDGGLHTVRRGQIAALDLGDQ